MGLPASSSEDILLLASVGNQACEHAEEVDREGQVGEPITRRWDVEQSPTG